MSVPITKARPRMRALMALLACGAALTGCGTQQTVLSAGGVRPFTVMLDRFPNADHAALYTALARGYFRAVGLQVRPLVPSEAAEPLQLLAAGRVDMAISYEPQLLLARDRGLKLVSVAALVQRPLASIIALPGAHVGAVAELAGRTLGTRAIPYQAAILRALLAAAGVSPASVRRVDVGSQLVAALESGRVAASFGGDWNYEAIKLREMHRAPLVIPADHAGVPTYDELVLVVREGEARRDGVDIRAFLQALSQGERVLAADPGAALGPLLEANPSLDRDLQLESITQTLPAARPANSAEPFGWQQPSAWANFAGWMYRHGLLTHDPADAGLPPYTNEFLPGQGI